MQSTLKDHRFVYFVVDEAMEGVYEGAGENLFVEVYRDELALGIVVSFVSRHTPPIAKRF